jgi:hypothetical protein
MSSYLLRMTRGRAYLFRFYVQVCKRHWSGRNWERRKQHSYVAYMTVHSEANVALIMDQVTYWNLAYGRSKAAFFLALYMLQSQYVLHSGLVRTAVHVSV